VTTKYLVAQIGWPRKLLWRVYMWIRITIDLYESQFCEASRPHVFSRIPFNDTVRLLFFGTNGSMPIREGFGGRFGAENHHGLQTHQCMISFFKISLFFVRLNLINC